MHVDSFKKRRVKRDWRQYRASVRSETHSVWLIYASADFWSRREHNRALSHPQPHLKSSTNPVGMCERKPVNTCLLWGDAANRHAALQPIRTTWGKQSASPRLGAFITCARSSPVHVERGRCGREAQAVAVFVWDSVEAKSRLIKSVASWHLFGEVVMTHEAVARLGWDKRSYLAKRL